MDNAHDRALNPFPSDRCRDFLKLGTPKAFDLCYFDGTHGDYTNFVERPDVADAAIPGGTDYSRFAASPGWGPGMLLAPYVTDWGDKLPSMNRRQLHATIMHAWPYREDRVLALILSHRFTLFGDDCDPPMTSFLIKLDAFAGWRWHAELMLDWLKAVEIDESCKQKLPSLAAPDALAAATEWQTRARGLWEQSTVELWPYDVTTVMPFWLQGPADAPLPNP